MCFSTDSVDLISVRAWVQSLTAHKLDMGVHTRNPGTLEAQTGISEVQGHPWLPSEFKASLNYAGPALKNKQDGVAVT